jgi:hypothetical protein
MAEIIVCLPKALPKDYWTAAAQKAIEINPLNAAPVDRLTKVIPGFTPSVEHLAVITTKYWQVKGVHLTVAFLDNPAADLRKRILQHMNAWGVFANVKFRATKTDPQVRIARTAGDGYWSYLGTDILQIPKNEPTMNLDSFSMDTPESEYHRVVRHETGHTMGFPHEHMRAELVAKIDPAKAIAFFEATQGWTEEEVRQQVLTPLEDASLLGTAHADPNSIMCYQIPGSITKDGQPIVGGTDIDPEDQAFAAKIYPKKVGANA